jgi:hypothetical protein
MLLVFSSYALNIREAIKQKLMKTEIRWKAEKNIESVSSRHGKNLCLAIYNITPGNLNIKVAVDFYSLRPTATSKI